MYYTSYFAMLSGILVIVLVFSQLILANTPPPTNRKSNKKYQTKSNDNDNNPYEKNTILYNDMSVGTNLNNNQEDACHLNIACEGNRGSQMRLPIYGPKGDAGPPGIPGMKGEKGEPGVAGIPAREPPPPNFSAFFAALKNNTGPFEQDKDLAFTHVITNYGMHYNPHNGIYTAPFNGVYQFFITVSATGRQKAGVNLMKNQFSILTIWSESHPWSTSSQTVVLKLQTYDRVYLRLQSRASHLHGYLYSSFGGSLLYEEINQL